jgi:hypothetical protein
VPPFIWQPAAAGLENRNYLDRLGPVGLGPTGGEAGAEGEGEAAEGQNAEGEAAHGGDAHDGGDAHGNAPWGGEGDAHGGGDAHAGEGDPYAEEAEGGAPHDDAEVAAAGGGGSSGSGGGGTPPGGGARRAQGRLPGRPRDNAAAEFEDEEAGPGRSGGATISAGSSSSRGSSGSSSGSGGKSGGAGGGSGGGAPSSGGGGEDVGVAVDGDPGIFDAISGSVDEAISRRLRRLAAAAGTPLRAPRPGSSAAAPSSGGAGGAAANASAPSRIVATGRPKVDGYGYTGFGLNAPIRGTNIGFDGIGVPETRLIPEDLSLAVGNTGAIHTANSLIRFYKVPRRRRP